MKRIIAIIGALCAMTAYSYGQGVQEIGIGMGFTSFFGSIGNRGTAGKSYFGDIAPYTFRPAGELFYAYSFNNRFSIKGSFSVAEIAGSDKDANSARIFDDGWYRQYRNLSFRSRILEVSATAQFNILKYTPGSVKYRWTPYLTAGVSLFDFNPMANYEGKWYALQPLGTEGQGLPEYPDRKKYDLIQPNIPLGAGVKYNINSALCIGLEWVHRICFTGYLDDVSKTYVSEQDFVSYYGVAKGELIYALSNRSVQIDPEGHYSYITQPGQARGDGKNEAYAMGLVTMSYNISKGTRREFNSFARRRIRRFRRVFK